MTLPPIARTAYVVLAIAATLSAIVIAVSMARAKRLRPLVAILVGLGLAPLVYQALVHGGVARDTYLRFENPSALFVFTAAAWLLAWRLPMLPGRMASTRRAAVTLLSSLSLLAAALAAARPELGRPLDRMTLILAVDRSRSLDLVPGGEARISAEIRLAEHGMHGDDRIGTVVFGAEAATEDPPRPKSDLVPPQRVEVGRDGTDLEAAIRRSLAELPVDTAGRVILLTDGVPTRGDAIGAAAAAVAADVPIDVVLLEQKPFKDVRVVSVRAPTRADEGESVDLRVVTSSAVPADVEVRVKRDGEVIHTGRAHITAGEDVLRMREIAGTPGLHRYDVEITANDPAADGSAEDNAGSTFVRVRGPSLALVLEGDDGKSAPLAAALRASGFQVAEGSTTAVPSDVGGLAGYDLVVLSDVRASDLATSQIDAIASYTKDLGGGLLLMGGDRSLGPGGYARTPIEDVSPVSFDLRQEKRRASLAEVIAIDYSGSMAAMVGGQTKLALANEAAARSASLLGPGDRLGVEHVDDHVAWTVPLGPVTDVGAVEKKIRSVDVGGGGIYTDISLIAAYDALARESVNLKHVLLFADGDDAEQITGCRAIVKGGAAKGITTSVISLGRGHDTVELEVLSKVGGGRFYLIDDATKLPAVFTQETILASKGAVHEDPFRVSLGGPTAGTRGIDFGQAPRLGGYVTTVPKPRATIALAGPENDPVLATWSVGIGHAATFTSDYKDRWGKEWLQWGGAAKMFGQLGRDIARRADDPKVRLESDASGGELHVRADVVGDDGRAQTFRRLTVHVAGPDGFARDIALEPVGAGRYGASVALARPGTYVSTAKDEISGDAVGTTGAALHAGEELRPTGSDRALLARIAAMTGGRLRDTLAGVFDDRAARRFAYSPLTSPLLIVAAAALLLGVMARRLGVPAFVQAAAQRAAARRHARDDRAAQERAHAIAIDRARDLDRIRANVLATRRAASHDRPNAGSILDRAPPGTGSPGAPVHDRPPVPPGPPIGHGQGPGGPPVVAPPGERQLTVAERLAQKRRERR